MEKIAEYPEIWLIYGTPWPTKNLWKSFCLNTSHNIYSQSKNFPIHFLWGSLRNACCITNLSWTCIGLKSRMSVVDAFTVITSHLVASKVIFFEKKSTYNFCCFPGFSSTCTYYSIQFIVSVLIIKSASCYGVTIDWFFKSQ